MIDTIMTNGDTTGIAINTSPIITPGSTPK
jgi:hypothetical protein